MFSLLGLLAKDKQQSSATMASDEADLDMQNLVDEVAERCLLQLRTERAQADQNQLEQINALLEHWSEQSFERTKALVLSNASNAQAGPAFSNNGFAEAAGDMRERQSSLLAVSYTQCWVRRESDNFNNHSTSYYIFRLCRRHITSS